MRALAGFKRLQDPLSAFLELYRTQRQYLDSRDQAEADRILDGLLAAGAQGARKRYTELPDGAEKNSIGRTLAAFDRVHVIAQDASHAVGFGAPAAEPIVERASKAFHSALQGALDLLFELRKSKVSGLRDVVLLGLLHSVVDDLLVGFHLAQRSFTNQSNGIVRIADETIEVVDLLAADEELLRRWAEAVEPDAERDIFRTVRRRAGETRTDGERRLHSFVSAVGAHAQFRGLRAKTRLQSQTATFYFMGSPGYLESANVLVVRSALSLMHCVVRHFGDWLNWEDARSLLQAGESEFGALVTQFSEDLSDQLGISANELDGILSPRRRGELSQ